MSEEIGVSKILIYTEKGVWVNTSEQKTRW